MFIGALYFKDGIFKDIENINFNMKNKHNFFKSPPMVSFVNFSAGSQVTL